MRPDIPTYHIIHRCSVKISQRNQEMYWNLPFSCFIVAVCPLIDTQQRRNFLLALICVLP